MFRQTRILLLFIKACIYAVIICEQLPKNARIYIFSGICTKKQAFSSSKTEGDLQRQKFYRQS